MKVIIKTKNIDLSQEISDFVEKKFFTLKKFIHPVKYRKAVISPKAKLFDRVNILKREGEIGKTLAEVFVEVEKETMHHKKGNIFRVKSRVYLPGREIISWARADDLVKAIVKAKDELKLEIEKYKFKIIDKIRRQQRKNNL